MEIDQSELTPRIDARIKRLNEIMLAKGKPIDPNAVECPAAAAISQRAIDASMQPGSAPDFGWSHSEYEVARATRVLASLGKASMQVATPPDLQRAGCPALSVWHVIDESVRPALISNAPLELRVDAAEVAYAAAAANVIDGFFITLGDLRKSLDKAFGLNRNG